MLNADFIAAAVFITAGIFAAGWAGILLAASPERLPALEKIPRWRIPGFIIGQIALLICVPHAAVVAPAFLLPWIMPLALIVPWLAVFFVDYAFARAFGGMVILLAYETVHRSFDLSLPGGKVIAVAAWIFGIYGIWLSGYPPLLRDSIRKAAAGKRFRYLATAAAGIPALIFFYAAAALLFLRYWR